jgi:hypothetical protein
MFVWYIINASKIGRQVNQVYIDGRNVDDCFFANTNLFLTERCYKVILYYYYINLIELVV